MANTDRITLDTYLANYSKTRRIDGVIKQWFASNYGSQYCIKTKEEWGKIIQDFFSKTEKKI